MGTAPNEFIRKSRLPIVETLHRNRVKQNRSGKFFMEGARSINQAYKNG